MPNKGFSGAEKVVIQIIKGIKDNFECYYISESGSINSYLEENKIKHIVTKKNLCRKELKNVMNTIKPDIVIANDYRASVIMSSIKGKYKLISHLHNNPSWIKKININSIMYTIASIRFDKIFIVSDSIKKEFIFRKLIEKKIFLVSNPLSRNDILNEDCNNYDKIYDIAFIGRFCEQKDPEKFIKIVNQFKERGKQIKALMMGDGSWKNKVIDWIGYYDVKDQQYVITGEKMIMKCGYDENEQKMYVTYVGKITADRRNINIKRSFRIVGQISFVLNSRDNGYDPQDNHQLVVMFKNHQDDNKQYQLQEEKFENLFGGWEIGLTEAVEKEKGKSAIIKYDKYEINGGQLIFNLIDCEKKSIDELMPPTRFVVESQGQKGVIYTEVGNFEEVVCDDDSVKIVLSLTKGRLKPTVRQLLNKNTPLLEDFRAKTMAYKRQFRAIFDLKKDEYSARSLKDIILCLDEPEEIKTISQPSFISKVLNQSQKQAVMKALNTENICLIQGPPGTGKTSVIKEIVGQIIKRDIKMTDSPKILIVSQSHTAVDNILEGLGKAIDNPLEIIRIGAERNISEEIATKYTIAAHREQLVSEIKNNVQQYVEQKNDLMNTITDKNEVKKWEEVKKIQEDWINRLVDQNSLDYQMIRSAVVIAGTCVGFLSNEVIKDMSFDYVIIDEAAKATTPELLVSIIKAKKIILVGDQNQLPAYADAEVSPTLAKLTKNPDYRLFDILYNSLPDTHKQILTTQYRMIENIGNLISKVFYRGIIDTGCNDDEKRHGLSRYVGKSIVWFDTSANKKKSQKRTKGGSYINEEEKRIILEILDDLKSTGELKGLDIGIITGYSGQKELLRKSIKATGLDKIASKIDINTLDAFQGRENDIIIYSTVRTRDSIGFQKEKERVNVAFSRAKKLLIVCGDKNFFYNFDDQDNKFVEIIDYISEEEECEIIQCDGGKLFERESNS